MFNRNMLLTCILILSLLTACRSTTGSNEVTVTLSFDPGPQQTDTAVAAQQAEQTAAAVMTEEAVMTADALATVDAQATLQAQETLSVQETAAAKTRSIQATGTHSALNTQSTKVAATAHAQPIIDLVQRLYDEGTITTTEGRLYEVDDFDESWAQINWYQWWDTGLTPERYVVTANLAWDSASKTANWFNTGCGFVFDATDNDNHFLVYLGLDGYANIERQYKGAWSSLSRKYYGKLAVPTGEAAVILVVEGDFVTFYVNDQLAALPTIARFTEGLLRLL